MQIGYIIIVAQEKIKVNGGYVMFKTETHLHTSEVSCCGRLTAAEMVESYKAAGYSTIVVTDHLYKRFADRLGDVSWEQFVDAFLEGYRRARAAAEGLDMVVLLGAELELVCHAGAKRHYLIYGEVEKFLRAHEWIYNMTLEELREATSREGICLVQAHPHRDGEFRPTPEWVDGIEVFNSNARHEDYDFHSIRVAREGGLVMTGGSDAHRAEDVAGSGIMTREPIRTSGELVRAIMSGEAEIIRQGRKIYLLSDLHGERDIEGLKHYLEYASDDDLLIILGDLYFGFDNAECSMEFTEWFMSLNKNIAFIDGNHENYGYINSFPEEEWCGGRVHRISDKIVHLCRGEIYNINGVSIFTFGGCRSSAKWAERGLWYEGDDPTVDEVEYAKEKLSDAGLKVDYVLTHKYEAHRDTTVSEALGDLVKFIEENVEYKKWYYGHWHSECEVDKKHIMIYKTLREMR